MKNEKKWKIAFDLSFRKENHQKMVFKNIFFLKNDHVKDYIQCGVIPHGDGSFLLKKKSYIFEK